MPFSFVNYYCDVPVWQGFVQTFFDTTTERTIKNLIHLLSTNPPEFILYQRQLEVLSLHEKAFNDSLPIPHRDLDNFILNNII